VRRVRGGPSRRVALPVAGVLLAAIILAVLVRIPSSSSSPERPAVAGVRVDRLPAAPRSGFAIGAPVPLARGRQETTWAAVRRDVVARARPSRDGRPVGTLAARTPEATTNIVLPTARRGLWVQVRLPMLPNGTTGWVPRSALGAYGTVRTSVRVDLARRRLTLVRDGRTLLRVPVGVGTPQAPTPRGRFVVRNRLGRYRSAFYGPVAFGTSARSATLTDWPGGGYIGIHGTNQPELIPGAVSHGCIRLRNADILRLARLMPVGTPITIR
jgi:hypothetical protein